MTPDPKMQPEQEEDQDQDALADEFEERLARILEKYPEEAAPKALRGAERLLEEEGIIEPEEEGKEEGKGAD